MFMKKSLVVFTLLVFVFKIGLNQSINVHGAPIQIIYVIQQIYVTSGLFTVRVLTPLLVMWFAFSREIRLINHFWEVYHKKYCPYKQLLNFTIQKYYSLKVEDQSFKLKNRETENHMNIAKVSMGMSQLSFSFGSTFHHFFALFLVKSYYFH